MSERDQNPDFIELKCKVLSLYYNKQWKLLSFEVLALEHSIYDNKVLEEKDNRVKLAYKIENLDDAQNNIFNKIAALTKRAVITIDANSGVVTRRDGYAYNKYTVVKISSCQEQ